jgi:hypothetical protein
LNTLNELAAALNDDANFASTVTSSLAAKANTADLATVATSGSYNDLTDQPVIAAGGGSFEAVASGALENGDRVIVNSDGTVSLPSLIYSSASLSQTLDNPNPYGTSASDEFGSYSVATSGNYTIVGARGEDDASNPSTGRAYIFNNSTGALVHTLDNPNAHGTGNSDEFGYAVAISGNYATVGARGESSAASNTYASGKAYIFNVTTGALLHTLDNPNAYGTSAGDRFARSVGITDTYAIVGAYLEDDAGGTQSGKAYIFNISTGALLHTLDNPNPDGTSKDDNFGYSVAISGTTGIVGTWGEDDAGGIDSGKVYIYNVTTGELLETLDNPNAYGTSAGDGFGAEVAISSDYIVASTFGEDDAGGDISGKVYIFNTVNTTTLTAENFVGVSDGAYADGATATIQTVGSVDDAQSGLTAGQAYFVQADGTLGLAPGTPRVLAGVAVSATKLLIGKDLPADAVAAYTDSDVATYLSGNGYDTATNIVALITDSAPATLDTLNELAAALGDDANFASTVTSSLALKADIRDTVYALTGTALDRANGGIQTKTLAANTTFTDSLVSGDSLVLQLEAGASYTVTWPTMQWVTSGGNVAPTLTAKDTLVFWKVSSTLYGAYTGSYV